MEAAAARYEGWLKVYCIHVWIAEQRVILRHGGLVTGLTTHHRELASLRMLYRALDLD